MIRQIKKANHWDIFIELIRTDFIMRYQNSVLGFVWVLLKPFLIFIIIVSVFSLLFKTQDPYYHLNLLLGLLIYSYFSEGTLRGVTSLFDKSSIILKVNFNKNIAIFTSVVNSLISFLAGFIVFLLFWFYTQPPASLINLAYFFLQIIILSGLVLALNLFTGIIYTKLRDLYSIWEVLLQLIFWSTPIVYPLTIIPDNLQNIALLNPLTVIITESRSALITGNNFSWSNTSYAFILTSLLLICGSWFFQKNIKKIAENF